LFPDNGPSANGRCFFDIGTGAARSFCPWLFLSIRIDLFVLMHRTFEVALPAHLSPRLTEELRQLDTVVGLSWHPHTSIKPKGDTLTIHVLNRGADEVLQHISTVCAGADYTIATAEQASLIDPMHDQAIENDVDEAIWEEMETGLRHHGRITTNFLLLMALGGALGAVGLTSQPAPQAIAFVAASVIAPGFEPIAKIPLGIVMGSGSVVGRGIRSLLAGYAVLIAAAALTFWILLSLGSLSVADFMNNPEVDHLAHPTGRELVVSGCGALAGGLIIAAYRRSVIAGALIAMVLIHAAAMIGVALVLGQWGLALDAVNRFGLDVGIVIVGCGLVFGLKQLAVHRRKPIV